MRTKNILSELASIIRLVIILLLFFINCKAEDNNIKYYSYDKGTLAIMYHRFNEQKYPSTNIQMKIFKEHIKIIKENDFDFYNPKDFISNFSLPKKDKKILLTIDDGFSSFYENAWPYLKKNRIPFILFVSTETVGKNGYMNWNQIKEVEKEKFAYIGNHSHSHKYLTDLDENDFEADIKKN